MEELFLQMLEVAKKDKVNLSTLKILALDCKQFDLATALREIELELFPETEEVKQAKEKALKLSTALAMASLQVPENICFLISEVFDAYAKKAGDFSISDAVVLKLKNERIFSI